jgi:transglutaminase-like putative cysteine protease
VLKLARILLVGAILLSANSARAQFEAVESSGGPRVDTTLVQKIKIGVEITAEGGPCRGLRATLPIPTAWPEQKVRVVDEKTTPSVRRLQYRSLSHGAEQMVVEIPLLRAGEKASAMVTFEVERNSLLPPEDTAQYSIPTKLDRQLQHYLGSSPYIETRHPSIVRLARQAGAGKEGWEKVEAIYDLTREKVAYQSGELKGAAKALADGTGDCEELTSLFIALCRNNRIPARMVWVHEHCYPEFYLVDDQGKGNWFPCQAAGTRAFGGIPEHRPILQKGDNFRDPDRPREQLRYVNEFVKGLATKGGGQPRVEFVRELVGG